MEEKSRGRSPQTVNENSEWAELWPDEDIRALWVHKIGNLLPLNKRRNSLAQNYPFKKKCNAYFAGRENVSSYGLTTQVLGEDEWTPMVVKKRQKNLLKIMKDSWRLHESTL
ncbi:HNH endonuclease family protein [Paracoccus fistulariae]|uniref:HNH endonuclease n=1 Tax=Paracoccus fistulariae TaxID=658446 RepID=A0ABY7SSI3_9RHOB|nr:HNH endonuclease [Paracoccus fistulariae]